MPKPAADFDAFFEAIPPEESSASAVALENSKKSSARQQTRDGTFWLDGGVLACACPECQAPMTIRLWLMMADCWRCGASVELTEEQEREVMELLASQEEAAPAVPASKSPPRDRTSPAIPAQKETHPRKPVEPPRPIEAPPKIEPAPALIPVPSPVASTVAAHSSLDQAELKAWKPWKELPAWLISLVIHLVVMLLAGMWTLYEVEEAPELVLSVEMSIEHREGGQLKSEKELNPNEFNLPVEKDPPTKQEKEALMRADEDAKELQISPEQTRNLPSLTKVKSDLVSADPYKRMHAARDPRVRAQIVTQEGGTTLTEAAVARGLRWISHHQNPDGSWSIHRFAETHDCRGDCNGQGGVQSDTSGTAMALMALLGAGQTHQAGIYRQQVSQGLRWLIERQTEDGDLRAGSGSNSGMYAHGQASIVLCDAFKLTGDEALRAPAQRAIDFICKAQHAQGGWRYSPGEAGDLSVVGWQLMALHSAKSAFLNVPKQHQNQASRYLDLVQTDEKGGLYAYMPGHQPTPAMTAEGLLSRMYLGWDGEDPGLKIGVNHLIANHLPSPQQRDIYYWYYATQVMHHWGGEPWETWNQSMRDVLVTSQETSGHAAGSWNPAGFPHGGAGGRLYVTSLSVCTLEVYYRYAPLYRRIKLD